MTILATPDASIGYDIRGSGHPIVMLPSGGHDRHDYDELREFIGKEFTTIALDWPGHGQSSPAKAPSTEGQLSDTVERFLDTLTPTGAVLVGNSIGGNIAARLAIRRPDLVAGLVIIDGGGFEQPRLPGRLFARAMSHPRFVRRIYPAFSRSYLRARTGADRRARESAIAVTRTVAGAAAVADMWASFGSPEHDLRADASRITAPTLIVWGRHDPVLPLAAADTARELIPGSRLLTLDTGHLPHTSDPAAVAGEVVALARTVFAERARPSETTAGPLPTKDPGERDQL